MSATTAPAALAELRTPAEVRRARIIGIIYLALAAFVLFVFAVGTEGNSTFGLARAGDRFENFPDLVLPSAGLGYTTAAVLAFFGGIQLTRGFGKRSTLVLGIGLLLFIFAFLGWAAAGKEFSLVGMLQLSVTKSVPITFGALSGVMCERVAVINIGIEGMLLGGAFMGALIGSSLGPWVGILAGMATGGLLALGLAVLAIRYRVDQIIAGVVINIFALGLTSFLTSQILVRNPESQRRTDFGPVQDPVAGRHSGDRADSLRPQFLCLRDVRAGRCDDLRVVPDPMGASLEGRRGAPQGSRHGGHQRVQASVLERHVGWSHRRYGWGLLHDRFGGKL